MTREVRLRSYVWLLALVVTAPLFCLGCGAERPAAIEGAAAVQAKPAAMRVVVLPDGSREIGPRITDVAMLKRLPNGTYERTCGPPDPETRTMMEDMMRARLGSRR